MTDPSNTRKIVEDLNAGWYNVISGAMGLDPTTFQLAQGTLGLQTSDSSGLFLMADAVPPPSSVGYYDAGGTSKRSSAYGLLLNALQPEGSATLRTELGNMYAKWVTYKTNYDFKPGDTQESVFDTWANQVLNPGQAAKAITVYKQVANNQLIKALDAYNSKSAQQQFMDAADNPYSLYKYSGSSDVALAALKDVNTPINFDSKTMDTKLKHTTVEGSASGFWDIFSGGASGSFDQLNTKAAGSQITISGEINQFGTMTTNPVEWFSSGEYMRAYNGKDDNTIWSPEANVGNWDSFFAQPKGSLARKVSQLFLIGQYSLTVTSHASYSQEDYKKITAKASGGLWPFFSASVSTTHTTDYKLNSDSTLSVTHGLPRGQIQIWGVSVVDAPN